MDTATPAVEEKSDEQKAFSSSPTSALPTPSPEAKPQVGAPLEFTKSTKLTGSVRVRNQTPQELTIKFEPTGQTVVFPPLAERKFIVDWEHEERAFRELENEGLIAYEPFTTAEKRNWEGFGGAIFVVVFFYIGITRAVIEKNPQFRFVLWIIVPLLALVAALIIAAVLGSGWITVRRILQQALTFILVLATGAGLAAMVIYYFGGGQQLLGQGPSTALLGRILQFTFIAVASLLPALLYFLFDRNRLSILRAHFEQQIFRFDPTVRTLSDVYAKYGSQLDELYGRDPTTAKGRHTPGTRWPIWVCTLVITIGWILTLPPVEANQPVNAITGIRAFLYPDNLGMVFGFLGAYYFAIFSISRRYTRGDLQPKAYSHIVVRIFVVFIFAWVVNAVAGSQAPILATIFVIGVLPDTFWTVLNEFLRNQALGFVHSLKEKHPLTNLEGIDPYDRARLAEEGVTNIESLAHHDLIDLILTTRIPVARLVDWVDQAILYLHLPDDSDGYQAESTNGSEDPANANNQGTRPLSTRQCLKTYGIRTATDFIAAYNAAQTRGRLSAHFLILDKQPDPKSEKPWRIEVLYDALRDDEWLSSISHWRECTGVVRVAFSVDHAGKLTQLSSKLYKYS